MGSERRAEHLAEADREAAGLAHRYQRRSGGISSRCGEGQVEGPLTHASLPAPSIIWTRGLDVSGLSFLLACFRASSASP
jgi:hypothetical protein